MKELAYKGIADDERTFVCIKVRLELYDDKTCFLSQLYDYLFGQKPIIYHRFQTFFLRWKNFYMEAGGDGRNLLWTRGDGVNFEIIRMIQDLIKGTLYMNKEEMKKVGKSIIRWIYQM